MTILPNGIAIHDIRAMNLIYLQSLGPVLKLRHMPPCLHHHHLRRRWRRRALNYLCYCLLPLPRPPDPLLPQSLPPKSLTRTPSGHVPHQHGMAGPLMCGDGMRECRQFFIRNIFFIFNSGKSFSLKIRISIYVLYIFLKVFLSKNIKPSNV